MPNSITYLISQFDINIIVYNPEVDAINYVKEAFFSTPDKTDSFNEVVSFLSKDLPLLSKPTEKERTNKINIQNTLAEKMVKWQRKANMTNVEIPDNVNNDNVIRYLNTLLLEPADVEGSQEYNQRIVNAVSLALNGGLNQDTQEAREAKELLVEAHKDILNKLKDENFPQMRTLLESEPTDLELAENFEDYYLRAHIVSQFQNMKTFLNQVGINDNDINMGMEKYNAYSAVFDELDARMGKMVNPVYPYVNMDQSVEVVNAINNKLQEVYNKTGKQLSLDDYANSKNIALPDEYLTLMEFPRENAVNIGKSEINAGIEDMRAQGCTKVGYLDPETNEIIPVDVDSKASTYNNIGDLYNLYNKVDQLTLVDMNNPDVRLTLDRNDAHAYSKAATQRKLQGDQEAQLKPVPATPQYRWYHSIGDFFANLVGGGTPYKDAFDQKVQERNNIIAANNEKIAATKRKVEEIKRNTANARIFGDRKLNGEDPLAPEQEKVLGDDEKVTLAKQDMQKMMQKETKGLVFSSLDTSGNVKTEKSEMAMPNAEQSVINKICNDLNNAIENKTLPEADKTELEKQNIAGLMYVCAMERSLRSTADKCNELIDAAMRGEDISKYFGVKIPENANEQQKKEMQIIMPETNKLGGKMTFDEKLAWAKGKAENLWYSEWDKWADKYGFTHDMINNTITMNSKMAEEIQTIKESKAFDEFFKNLTPEEKKSMAVDKNNVPHDSMSAENNFKNDRMSELSSMQKMFLKYASSVATYGNAKVNEAQNNNLQVQNNDLQMQNNNLQVQNENPEIPQNPQMEQNNPEVPQEDDINKNDEFMKDLENLEQELKNKLDNANNKEEKKEDIKEEEKKEEIKQEEKKEDIKEEKPQELSDEDKVSKLNQEYKETKNNKPELKAAKFTNPKTRELLSTMLNERDSIIFAKADPEKDDSLSIPDNICKNLYDVFHQPGNIEGRKQHIAELMYVCTVERHLTSVMKECTNMCETVGYFNAKKKWDVEYDKYWESLEPEQMQKNVEEIKNSKAFNLYFNTLDDLDIKTMAYNKNDAARNVADKNDTFLEYRKDKLFEPQKQYRKYSSFVKEFKQPVNNRGGNVKSENLEANVNMGNEQLGVPKKNDDQVRI